MQKEIPQVSVVGIPSFAVMHSEDTNCFVSDVRLQAAKTLGWEQVMVIQHPEQAQHEALMDMADFVLKN